MKRIACVAVLAGCLAGCDSPRTSPPVRGGTDVKVTGPGGTTVDVDRQGKSVDVEVDVNRKK